MRTVAVRGSTLIELLVTLALSMVVVLSAAQLVAESVALVETGARAVRSPPLLLAVATVRRDVQTAAAVLSPPAVGWTQHPLELVDWEGRRVCIAEEDGAIVRTVSDPLGGHQRRRVVIRGVTSWWWRSSGPRTVDIRITALIVADPSVGGTTGAARRTEIRRFVMRGGLDGRSW
jgi:hypothetical protein